MNLIGREFRILHSDGTPRDEFYTYKLICIDDTHVMLENKKRGSNWSGRQTVANAADISYTEFLRLGDGGLLGRKCGAKIKPW